MSVISTSCEDPPVRSGYCFSRPSTASSVSKCERGVSTKLERPSSRSSSSNGVRYLMDEAGVSQGFCSLVQSEVGTNWFEGGTLIPGEVWGEHQPGCWR